MTKWQTEQMQLGGYEVQFSVTQDHLHNFYPGENIEIEWTATDGKGRFGEGTITRKIRYSRDQGKYFKWYGYAICYEDFDNPIEG